MGKEPQKHFGEGGGVLKSPPTPIWILCPPHSFSQTPHLLLQVPDLPLDGPSVLNGLDELGTVLGGGTHTNIGVNSPLPIFILP